MKSIINKLIKYRRKHYRLMKKEQSKDPRGNYMHGFQSGVQAGINIALKLLKEQEK